jgi:hypothetical protein
LPHQVRWYPPALAIPRLLYPFMDWLAGHSGLGNIIAPIRKRLFLN